MTTIGFETAAGVQLAQSVTRADNFLRRFIGLLAHRGLAQDEGLLLVPGGSIHTFGMRFAIDVIFLDARFAVLRIVACLPPQSIAKAPPGTRSVLEISAGRASSCALRVGDQLALTDCVAS